MQWLVLKSTLVTEYMWPEYLRQITDDAMGTEIAKASGVPAPTISRWLSGQNRPQPRQVVAVARAYGADPIRALIAADYLDPADADLTNAPKRLALAEFSDLDLAREIVRRVENGGSIDLERPLDGEHPAMETPSNVTRLPDTRTSEAEELDAVAKRGDKVIEVDEFE